GRERRAAKRGALTSSSSGSCSVIDPPAQTDFDPARATRARETWCALAEAATPPCRPECPRTTRSPKLPLVRSPRARVRARALREARRGVRREAPTRARAPLG